MAKQVIKAIFFDVDDTMYSTSIFAARARWNSVRAISRLGVKLTPRRLHDELQEVIAEFSSNYPNHFEKLLLRLPEVKSSKINPAILVAGAVMAYHDAKPEGLKPFNDVLWFLRKMRRHGLTVGVITEGLAVKQAEKLLRLGVYPALTPTAVFISDQLGISKPNPKLFLRACRETHVSPKETIYVGNSPHKDIDPANAAGMITARVNRLKKHAKAKGRSEARYTVQDFKQLYRLLERDFRFPR